MTAVLSTPRWATSSPSIYSVILRRANEWPRRRSEVVEALAKFIVEGIDRLGGALLVPPLTFAQILVATSDSVVLASELDDVDLYRPVIEMYVSAIKMP